MELNLASMDRASLDIDRLITKRATGKERANGEAARDAEAARRRQEQLRERNRELWREHCERMYRSHAALASSYAAKALELEALEGTG